MNKIKFRMQNTCLKIRSCYYIYLKKNKIMTIKKSERGTGKTTFMVNYAREHNYTIIYKTDSLCKYIKDIYNYNNVIPIHKVIKRGKRRMNVMVDEPCSIEDIKRIEDIKHNIILAYVTI